LFAHLAIFHNEDVTKFFTGVTITGVTTSLRTERALRLPPPAASTFQVHTRLEKFLESGETRRCTHAVTEALIYFFGQGTNRYNSGLLLEAALSHHF